MVAMVRMQLQQVRLVRSRPPRVSTCKRSPMSFFLIALGMASLAFLLLTEVGMIQKRNGILPARPARATQTHLSSKKSTYTVAAYRADTFKIEPLLRRDAPSLELTAQMQLNQLYSGRISRDVDKYYNAVKCRQGSSTNCSKFTLVESNGKPTKWWTKPDCPAYPPNLLPPREIHQRMTVRLSHVEEKASRSRNGGSWAPSACLSRHNVAIIIPYRDRWRHLTTLMNHLHPLLQRQQIQYKMFVVEQYGNETFNKGIIMNAAFLEALHEELFDCVIFHDVDLIPETDYNMYTCPQMPRHLSVAVNELHYRLPYYVLVGGVLAMRTEHFFKVNGYSNLYWGWGGEDDDMGMRIQQAGMPITRPLPPEGRYTMIKHVKRSGIEHRVRSKLVRTAKRRYRLDGLNTVQYRLVSKTENPWFTNLLVDVGIPPPSLRTDKPNA